MGPSSRRAKICLLASWAALVLGCGAEDNASRQPEPVPPASPEEPEPPPEPPEPVGEPAPPPRDELGLGGVHSCVLRGGRVACWGGNQFAQLGDPSLEQSWAAHRPTPADVAGVEGAVRMSTGGFHSCVVTDDREVKCWGHGGHGQLGRGAREDSPTPEVPDELGPAIGVAAGEGHTCVLDALRQVHCFGRNTFGQLGDGTREDRLRPQPVPGLDDIRALAAGKDHTCAIRMDGQVLCWGSAIELQLGDGDRRGPDGIQSTPHPVEGLVASTLALGAVHGCALTEERGLRCFGANDSGQIAGRPRDRGRPVDVDLMGVQRVAAGGRHTCALSDRMFCWGANGSGQLGDGNRAALRRPTEVAVEAVAIGVGARHTCALAEDDTVRCWGKNHRGQLGDGTVEDRYRPVKVEGLSPRSGS
ncbi:MAG: hypothetical protein AAGF12_19160 [Myxococcota bacterium]